MSQRDWDLRFLKLAKEIASWSKCSSRHISAILVRDKMIVGAGYNGSPKRSSMCQDPIKICLRRAKGYKSGEGLHECPAAHAELNAIIQAAYHGISTKEATIYVWAPHPCKDCTIAVINAGISRVVCLKGTYDDLSVKLSQEAVDSGILSITQYEAADLGYEE